MNSRGAPGVALHECLLEERGDGDAERGEDRGGTCVWVAGRVAALVSDLEMEDVVQRPELKAVPELRAAGEVALGDGCVRELYEI